MTAVEFTPYYGFRIPPSDGDDYQDVDDLRVPILAIDARIKNHRDLVIAGAIADTGWDNSSVLVIATGWAVLPEDLSKCRIRNGMTQVSIAIKRTGAAIISDPAGGNITESLICTVNSTYRPLVLIPATCHYGDHLQGMACLEGDGRIMVQHLAPGLNLNTNDVVYCSFMFIDYAGA